MVPRTCPGAALAAGPGTISCLAAVSYTHLTFTVETGKVAELANAEAICRYGDTVVLVTVTASALPKVGIDYFPLTIEVEERMYAVGRIPGSFNRREGRPSERGTLISRPVSYTHLDVYKRQELFL